MKIWIYPNDGSNPSNAYDITPYLQNYDAQTRSDDAFALTTFKIMIPEDLFSLAKFNIQPFTVFEMGEVRLANTNKRFFGYSKCSKYLRTQHNSKKYYTHDVTLLEPTALLEAIQIGAKTFTNHTDYEYLQQLSVIIHNTTGYNVTFSGTYVMFNNIMYSFDKGVSAYQIANEIFKRHNFKIKTTLGITTNAYAFSLAIEPIDLFNIPTIAIDDDRITLAEYEQNQDDYCYSLESQVDNVVDRNTVSLYDDLTCRTDNNSISKDNCYIELPANVENVRNLYVQATHVVNVTIGITFESAQAIIQHYGSNNLTWHQITEYADYLDDIADELKRTHPNFKPYLYEYDIDSVGPPYHVIATNYYVYGEWVDISNKCVDIKVYEMLEPQEQTSYCYFESGKNYIKGIYEFYKDDWIHDLIGESAKPMLENIEEYFVYESDVPIYVSGGETTYCTFVFRLNLFDTNPLNVKWRAFARPITSQYVKDLKRTAPYNAANHVVSARSYGNSANFIDYDLMLENIMLSNNSLGTPELTLQFSKNCDLTPYSKFSYDNKTWYVKSVIMRVFKSNITYDVNAAIDYNKQADVIGVKTQYEATKLALENTKERHLYFRYNDSKGLQSHTYTYYLYVKFKYRNNTTKDFLLRCNFYANDFTGVTLVVNLPNNYSAGTYLDDDYIGSQDQRIVKDASYVDNMGEALGIDTLAIVHFDNSDTAHSITIDDSRKLPLVENHNFTIDVSFITQTDNYLIYKDEHESLSFTIYLPNGWLIN